MKWLKDNSVWVALALAFGIGAYYFFVDLKRPVTEPGENPKIGDLAGVTAGDVTRMEIKKGGPPIVLAKSGTEWNLESPVKSKADSEEVNRLLQGLLTNQSDFILENAKDLKQYRLDPPEFELALTEKDGEKHTLQFGMQEPAKHSVYTRDAQSGKIFLANSGSVDPLRSKDQNGFRDKTLIPIPSDQMQALTIQKPAGTIKLAKGEGDHWRLSQPWDAPAESFTVSGMTSALAGLKGDRFIAADVKDLAKYGLAAPQITVNITGEDGKAAGIRVGKKTTDRMDYYASAIGTPHVLTITEATFQALNKTARDLRSKRIADFETVNVERFAVTAPNGSWEVEKSGTDWKMVKPNPGQKANSQTVENLLMDMTTQAAAHVTEKADNLAQYGLDKPQLTATVTLKGNQKQQLFVGKKAAKGANYYARGSQAPNAVFELGGYIFDNLNKKPDALK